MARKASNGVSSSVVTGVVTHGRMEPRPHAFSYPMVTLQLDVDELERGACESLLFGFYKKRLVGVRSEDYLVGKGSLREKLQVILEERGVQESPCRITLVTMPRLFGYVFNPVSFFLCFNQGQQLIGCVTQVHNTFGEAHLYPLVCEPRSLPVSWRFPKEFFVSPFFDSEGEYEVRVDAEGDTLGISVNLFKAGSQIFAAYLEGRARPLTTGNLLKTLIRYPLTLFCTIPRIHIQALILFLRVKVIPFLKPIPTSPYTIRSQQNTIHRTRLWLISKMRDVRLRSR